MVQTPGNYWYTRANLSDPNTILSNRLLNFAEYFFFLPPLLHWNWVMGNTEVNEKSIIKFQIACQRSPLWFILWNGIPKLIKTLIKGKSLYSWINGWWYASFKSISTSFHLHSYWFTIHQESVSVPRFLLALQGRNVTHRSLLKVKISTKTSQEVMNTELPCLAHT